MRRQSKVARTVRVRTDRKKFICPYGQIFFSCNSATKFVLKKHGKQKSSHLLCNLKALTNLNDKNNNPENPMLKLCSLVPLLA